MEVKHKRPNTLTLKAILLCLVTAGALGCDGPINIDVTQAESGFWKMEGASAERAFCVSAVRCATVPMSLWKIDLKPGNEVLGILLDGDVAVIHQKLPEALDPKPGGDPRLITAIRLKDGKELWKSKPGLLHGGFGCFGIGNGLVVTAGNEGICALRLKDGSLAWQHSYDWGEPVGPVSLAIRDEYVVVTARDSVYCNALSDGRPVWVKICYGNATARVAISNDKVLICCEYEPEVICLSLKSGETCWKREVISKGIGDASAGCGWLALCGDALVGAGVKTAWLMETSNEDLFVLDGSGKTLRMNCVARTARYFARRMAIGHGKAFMCDFSGLTTAYDLVRGGTAWNRRLSGESHLAVTKDVLLCLSDNGDCYGLKPETGEFLWHGKIATFNGEVSCMAIGTGYMLASDKTGLYAFSLSNEVQASN